MSTFLAIFLLSLATSSAWLTTSPCRPSRALVKSPPTLPRLVTLRSRVEDGEESSETTTTKSSSSSANHYASKPSLYNLGIGKNRPVFGDGPTDVDLDELYWNVAEAVHKPLNATSTQRITPPQITRKVVTAAATAAAAVSSERRVRRVRKMVAKTQEDASLRGAIWHEEHYNKWKEIPLSDTVRDQAVPVSSIVDSSILQDYEAFAPPKPQLFYPDIDLSIPEEVYSDETDAVWDLMRWEAFQEAKREPLLVSFLYSSILNHQHLESSLAFLLASRLSSPAMISTQIQSLILEALEKDKSIGRKLRADIMAVRDRDPACTCLPDVFLYFKGFHALQTYRVANVLWKNGKRVISRYLQSQMSQTFQIDIHPNATLGSGIMFDHGTGIVIGETATVGNNCSILHHVTLGGSGKKGVDRHPKVGNGVLLGAGASVVGNIKIGDGCQVGAGTLVITDIPAHSVAVGVPAKIIGSFVDVTEQPSVEMNQMMDRKIITFQTDGI